MIETGIEWAHATWNPWIGCKMVSPGCTNCYMFRDMARYGKDPNVVARSKTTFEAPLKWARAWEKGVRDRKKALMPNARIFTCSWSDWFIEAADEWRPEAWEIIKATPYVYLILTKRAERIAECLPDDWGEGYPNVWLGVTAENQKYANARIPFLLKTSARVRWVSAEPLLGPIDFTRIPVDSGTVTMNVFSRASVFAPHIDWVVTGGESDPSDPRPMELDWARQIRDDCVAGGKAFFHKQHGGKAKVEGAWGGRELDGQLWSQFPA